MEEDPEKASRGREEGQIKNFQEVHERQSVVVGPRVSRHNTTTAESSSVKRSEEEMWSQKEEEDNLDERRAVLFNGA